MDPHNMCVFKFTAKVEFFARPRYLIYLLHERIVYAS